MNKCIFSPVALAWVICLVFLGAAFAQPSQQPALSILTERARMFEEVNLPFVAREQYRLILRLYPDAPGVDKSLLALSRREAAVYVKNARRAHEAGVLPLALRQLNRALTLTPEDAAIKALHAQWSKEERLRAGLHERVSKEYLEGLRLFQNGQYDRALENFLRVLNLDPNHKGAMGSIERIGQKMEVGTRE